MLSILAPLPPALNSDTLSNLTTDLAELSKEIDAALLSDKDLTPEQAKALLAKLNLLVDVYS